MEQLSHINEGESRDELGVPGEDAGRALRSNSSPETGSGISTSIPHAPAHKPGVDVTVYAIRKGRVYLVDANGQKYSVPPIPGLPYHIGMRMINVTFSDP